MKKILFFAILLSIIPCIALAGSVPITLAWGAVPDADGGYKFYLKPVAADTLTEIGTSAAGTTTVTIPLALPDGKYTVHAVACDVAGNQSDLSLPATLNDTGTVVYLMKPGKATVKIKTVH